MFSFWHISRSHTDISHCLSVNKYYQVGFSYANGLRQLDQKFPNHVVNQNLAEHSVWSSLFLRLCDCTAWEKYEGCKHKVSWVGLLLLALLDFMAY